MLVRGEALCKEKQVVYVTETATVTETLFLKFLDYPKLDTHTHPVVLLYTSDQLVTQTATNTTHNKHYRRISMLSAGFEHTIAGIKELQPTP